MFRRWYKNELGSFGEQPQQPGEFAGYSNHSRFLRAQLLLKQAMMNRLHFGLGKARSDLGNVGHDEPLIGIGGKFPILGRASQALSEPKSVQ